MIQIIHCAVKGRARYKILDLYRSRPLKEYLESRLSLNRDVISASASDLTGNVLVTFNSGNSCRSIGEFLANLLSEYKERCEAAGNSDARPVCSVSMPESLDSPPLTRGETNPSSLGSSLKAWTRWIGQEEQPASPWHIMGADEVLSAQNSTLKTGLSSEAAHAHLRKYGMNALPDSAGRSGFTMLIGQFQSLPVALLGAAAAISVVTGGIADALVILGVVGINAAIGFVTESEAERTITSLKNLVKPNAHVTRDGVTREIPVEEVVPGDLVVLRPGTYVPADSRLVEAFNLSVDESALTGESLPALKSCEALIKEDIPLADRVNMVFMGTLVTGGQGVAVVVATGKYTEMGQLHMLVGKASAPETPMEKQLERMGNQLVLISGAVCGVVFVLGFLRGYGFLQMLKSSISLAVAAVPEGLPTIATTTLALGIRKMRGHQVLIRKLNAVETLGALQTICFDKTGTVTENRMSVRRVYTGMQHITVLDASFRCGSGPLVPCNMEDLRQLLTVCVLCSETHITHKDGKVKLHGTSTENALVHMTLSAGMDAVGVRRAHPLLQTRLRTEDRHYMATLHMMADGRRLTAVKGSPLEVLAMCDRHFLGGVSLPLTDADRKDVEIVNERMAGDALRVLGFAFRIVENDEQFEEQQGFIWLGLTGMVDPVRPGVKELIPLFHEAGIETIMITGDQTSTAYAIGKELNLSRGDPIEILDSSHLAAMDAEALRALSQRVHVFSRVSPANKLQIVQALQKSGRIVAMTGDGINDGPALKAADIGVALGETGTDIAREVADVVLEKDDLETMIVAVSHGRTIHRNIRKSLHFLLSTNFSEIMVMFLATAVGLGHPLTAIHLLWINLMSDIFPGLALALEPPEPDVMKEPPRDPEEPVVGTSDFKRISFEAATISTGAMAAYAYGISRYGMGVRASTMAFQSLTLGQLLHVVSCRSETHSIFSGENLPPNRYLTIALGWSLALQSLTMIVPGMRALLGVAPLGIGDIPVIAGTALIPLLVNEATKNLAQGENYEK